jgi:acyl-CoA dehydrogenase
MDFQPSSRSAAIAEELSDFMEECIYPAEAVYTRQLLDSGEAHAQPAVMEQLKETARQRGLWNLFHPDAEYGAGLTYTEYAPLAEILGRSAIASEACNCSAPDTGNMELLSQFGSPAQRAAWLRPLLDGEIRSAFAMTEPDVGSSDATNVRTRIDRSGDEYVINGRKWWITNALHPHCRVFIVMGKTDVDAPTHRQQSMILVPRDTPGVNITRSLNVFGYADQESHCEVEFTDVRVPAENIIHEEGAGFAIAQARLGPGRIHHCMRALGAAERALELMCRRASERVTFGAPIASRSNVMDWIAESRAEIDMGRLLTLKTAWLIDTVGNRHARTEIAAIKVAVPRIAAKVIDRAIQVHGSGGLCDDFPLAAMYALVRCLRLADGPDEVHNVTIARRELAKYTPAT